MPETLTDTQRRYAQRALRRVCVRCLAPAAALHVYCEACLEQQRRWNEGERGLAPTIAGPAVAHCGQWHPVQTVPWTCPTCGWVWDTVPEGAGTQEDSAHASV